MNALILVDIQKDFLPGGALAVPEGHRILPLVNRIQPCFDLVVATQDWHPPHHGSFAAHHAGRRPGDRIDLHGLPQVLWPVHCVQGGEGAEFAPELDRRNWHRIVRKGAHPDIDSYSGFHDNGHRRATELADILREQHVTEVYVAGLATDYCVKYTVLDALEYGFRTYLIEDACRGVDLQPGDVQRAIREMREAGAEIVATRDILEGAYA